MPPVDVAQNLQEVEDKQGRHAAQTQQWRPGTSAGAGPGESGGNEQTEQTAGSGEQIGGGEGQVMQWSVGMA